LCIYNTHPPDIVKQKDSFLLLTIGLSSRKLRKIGINRDSNAWFEKEEKGRGHAEEANALVLEWFLSQSRDWGRRAYSLSSGP
jgi:hypothetical protein